jgi:hypothetical protein
MGFYILPDNKGFYDPDGFFFDEEGFDKYGGYYDNDGSYHPGKGNIHEFPDYQKSKKDSDQRRGGNNDATKKGKGIEDIDDDDELIKAFERGDDEIVDEDHDDPNINKYLNEYKHVEEIIAVPEPLEEE